MPYDASADLLRNLTLGVPVAALLVVVALRRSGVLVRRAGDVPHAAMASMLVWVGVLAVEQGTDLWRFAAGPTTFLGMPLETSLGWAVAWGALPVLAGGRLLLWWGGLAWLDVLVMPRLEPLLVLSPGWWAGELLLLVLVAAPALVLGRATRDRTLLPVRVLLQLVTVTGLVLWVVPTVAFAHGGGSWAAVVDHPLPVRTGLLMAAALFGVPALAAVAELARVGRGTPYPWDPPERLVTTGPYAYLANPMQLGASAMMLLLAVAAGSPALLLAGAFTVAFSAAVAERHEQHTMRDWEGYADYRRHVRAWWPRRRPWVPVEAALWVGQGCGVCRATGEGLAALEPTGLRILHAEDAGVTLTRMRWVGGGTVDRGVAAWARALEHSGLGRAWLGWLVRLPGVTWAVQTAADACGLGPRAVSGGTHRPEREESRQ